MLLNTVLPHWSTINRVVPAGMVKVSRGATVATVVAAATNKEH